MYVNFPKIVCLYRILKRFFSPNTALSDRVLNCREHISFSFLKYMWYFDKRVVPSIAVCKERYPDVIFREISNKRYVYVKKCIVQNINKKTRRNKSQMLVGKTFVLCANYRGVSKRRMLRIVIGMNIPYNCARERA